ncbi:MAG: 3-isopropylmalate dehydratase small subunit [Anaerolineales bacterium]|jgi:3-isopropylmalate/(R)-2-methylmalate dehydratase small subunit
MKSFTKLTSKVIPLLHNNIDTDQIIPARYLKATDKASVAEGLFADWRYKSDGTPKPDFVLNQPEHQGAQILLAGDNFGCGSSREHAPWALAGSGIQVVLSTSFADIFKNNALKNGLLPVEIDAETYENLCDLIEEIPTAEVTIDLEKQRGILPDGSSFEFPIDSFSKQCLLKGTDQFGYIQSFEEKINEYEQGHPFVN